VADKTVYSPNEVAALFNVSPVTVRQWAQKGLLEAQITAGGHRRFTLASLRRFAQERGVVLPALEERLLIVDDNRQLNGFLVALFAAQCPDVPVASAYDGFHAGRMVQQFDPSVVLLDIMMPGIDGIEVCASLKRDPSTAHIRVIGMTGHHTPELEARLLHEGAETLLRKPFGNDEVIAACGFETTTGSTTSRD
jgi:excisionase family DNA binding protein